MKIITVTLNPAMDKTIEVEHLIPESLNKVITHRSDIGGKGINVSRVLKVLGTESLVAGFVAGGTGKAIVDGLQQIGVTQMMTQINGETRTNLKIFDRTSRQITEINEPGPEVENADMMDLAYGLAKIASDECLFVFSGSIPKGLSQDCYAELIETVKEKGAHVFLDADNEAFKYAVEALPDMIKPNKEELERYFNRIMKDEMDIIEAIKHFLKKGIKHVFVTMGSHGAYYGSDDIFYKMSPLKIDAHSSVGAGDAFVGAACHAFVEGYDTERMLKWCVATSAGAVATIGTNPAELGWILENAPKVILKRIGGVI